MKAENKIKVGIDIHGVLDTIPDTIKEIMNSLICNGNEVHIITGIPFEFARPQLEKLDVVSGVHYTHFFSIEEKLLSDNCRILGKNKKGRNVYPDIEWDSAKGIYCKENKIDLMLDDSPIYQCYFTTPYAYIKV